MIWMATASYNCPSHKSQWLHMATKPQIRCAGPMEVVRIASVKEVIWQRYHTLTHKQRVDTSVWTKPCHTRTEVEIKMISIYHFLHVDVKTYSLVYLISFVYI